MHKLPMSENDVNTIVSILERGERQKIEATPGLGSIWFHSQGWNTELRILFLVNYRVTISRVDLQNKRQGTMTEILSFLQQYCRTCGIQNIVIQSVQTKEMMNFAIEHGFTSVPATALELENGLIIGDYIKRIE